jgi:hypothetical protein
MKALRLLWSALWRVQASHLAVFVLAPVAAAAVRAAIGVVLLPFLLVGFGDLERVGLAEVGHLRSAGCWVALAPCPLADLPLVALPLQGSAATSASPYARESEPFLPLPTDLTPRHAWFALWLGWFMLFLVRRARRRRAG